MRRIKSKNLAQLLMQLRFTPRNKRRKELDAAEKLFSIVDPTKEYPFEFVCFRITGFHPKAADVRELIRGDQLLKDLRVFIAKLSGPLAPPVAEQTEKVHTVEDLAKAFGVSTKTIRRWQSRGLFGRKFVFDDGLKRVGFLQSALDQFVNANPRLIGRAKNFALLAPDEKDKIVKRARKLADTGISRYQVIETLVSQTKRSHETIRYTLLNYEKAHPEKPLFTRATGVIDPAHAAEIYRLFKQGSPVSQLTQKFHRSRSSVYRILNRRRAKALLLKRIEFIPSDDFLRDDARSRILEKPLDTIMPAPLKSIEPFKPASSSLPRYLRNLKDAPVLNRNRELELFRRYNYLKYLACITRAGIKPASVPSATLTRIEQYLAEAETIQKAIIEANLRLVVGIARRHTAAGPSLPELVSDGNISLMRAVEKFDYARGFRFATYASWTIAKDFARKIPAEAARRDKTAVASLARMHQDIEGHDADDFAAMERARQSLAQVIKDELDEREQYVILNRFGPIGLPIKRKTKTLRQIGDDLGLTRERVRQLELVALQKLRHSLSAEEFELLTG
jgi:RNA polymerase primary sigma factor